ncbi:DNA primase large subunit PriL [Methanofollis fontis]|uniref:DNA primase large subunit PriL n=1 Tax=Methanofollis fontis TaxID=2052832 RepID=A0A483CUN6_9EURY|nr:DNA primase large subunit PriL [Methanofollis fontis]TAJ44647.1 DNA primase regulatory subunit PriL [Methanofollis fontis]
MVDIQDLAKYPFLEEAQIYLRSADVSLELVLKSEKKASLLEAAVRRVTDALMQKKPPEMTFYGRDAREDLITYVLARMLVSCLGDRLLIDRLVQYESRRSHARYVVEEEETAALVGRALGIDPDGGSLPVIAYVELVGQLRDDRWRLVNRCVVNGQVSLLRGEVQELVAERMRLIMKERLPLPVPESQCRLFSTYTDTIAAALQQRALEEFGEVDESSFPPCIAALIGAVTAGTNLPHVGRFALTAFLHNIGLTTDQIVEVFQRAPDFDVGMTLYQVEHISGSSGTEYTAPMCGTMRTHGLCVNRDALCERVNHPLSYYKRKKWLAEKKGLR